MMIAAKDKPSSSDWDTINNLRTQLPNALVTIYKYEPLFGISETTNPQGITVYYVYDSFGRLKEIKDGDGKKIEEYEYRLR